MRAVFLPYANPFILRASCSCLSRLLRHAWQGSGSILYPTHRAGRSQDTLFHFHRDQPKTLQLPICVKSKVISSPYPSPPAYSPSCARCLKVRLPSSQMHGTDIRQLEVGICVPQSKIIAMNASRRDTINHVQRNSQTSCHKSIPRKTAKTL